MSTVKVSELRANIAEISSRVAHQGERVRVQRNGKPFFALVTIDDLELLERLEDQMDLELAREALERNDFEPWARVKKRLGL